MSVSGLKAELKFLESIFDKDHERFRIVSWKLDELHCQFVLLPPPPGSSPQPPPPLTIHCNITVRGPRGAGRAGHGPPSPLSAGRGEGAQPRRGDSARGGGRSLGAPGALPAATITKVTGAGRPRPLLLPGGGSSRGLLWGTWARGKHAGRGCGFGAGSREPEQRAAEPGAAGTEPRGGGRGSRGAPRPGPAAAGGWCCARSPEQAAGGRFSECATRPRPGAGPASPEGPRRRET